MYSAMLRMLLAISGLSILFACATDREAGPANMTFFITSVGLGKGADLGGLAGAGQHCQALAKAVGAGNRTWRAYLSTQAPALSDPNFVNARDRIGTGPWHNAKGVMISRSVEDLHSPSNTVTKQTALDEKVTSSTAAPRNPTSTTS